MTRWQVLVDDLIEDLKIERAATEMLRINIDHKILRAGNDGRAR
jgi:hypothetical protein